MTKYIRFSALIAFFCLFIVVNLAAEAVYTTGLNLKKSGNRILLEWKANTAKGIFNVYRTQINPISGPSSLSNAFKVNSFQLEGTPAKDLFLFTSVTDTVSVDGNYYYLVLPDKAGSSLDDYSPNLNYNISPVMYKKDTEVAEIDDQGPLLIEEADEAETGKAETPVPAGDKVTVKSVFIKTNLGVFQVFWDMDAAAGDFRFAVYRTTNRVISSFDFQKIKPVTVLTNEYFYEDTGVKYGVPYFYTIIVNDYKMILAGENQNKNPVFWGNTNASDIKVERDVYRRIKVNTKSFNSRFKK